MVEFPEREIVSENLASDEEKSMVVKTVVTRQCADDCENTEAE